MRMTIITNKAGEVVGTASHRVEGVTGSGTGGPTAGPEHTLHDVEVPEDLERIQDVAELHGRLQSLLSQ
jgi:hypothetical protein